MATDAEDTDEGGTPKTSPPHQKLSPHKKKTLKQPQLPWDGAHSHALADWKQSDLMKEFTMDDYEWGLLSLDVSAPCVFTS
jgi:hypothetical protein